MHTGIEAAEAAAAHAERRNDGWKDLAYEALCAYAKSNPVVVVEDVRHSAEAAGVPLPPTARAWGSVIVRAAREGVVTKMGHVNSSYPPANPHPISMWRSLVCGL